MNTTNIIIYQVAYNTETMQCIKQAVKQNKIPFFNYNFNGRIHSSSRFWFFIFDKDQGKFIVTWQKEPLMPSEAQNHLFTGTVDELIEKLKEIAGMNKKAPEIVLTVTKDGEKRELKLTPQTLCHLVALSRVNWDAPAAQAYFDRLYKENSDYLARPIQENYKNSWMKLQNLELLELTEFLGYEDATYSKNPEIPAPPSFGYELKYLENEKKLFKIGCQEFSLEELEAKYKELFGSGLINEVKTREDVTVTEEKACEILNWAKKVSEIVGN